jgi:aminodeoxyfutalosine deaminase
VETLYSLKARYVFPVTSPPLENGVVTIANGRILSVSPAPNSSKILDLGNAAILPGLVNAHTHLEFSDLTEPIGFPGIGLAAWIRRLMEIRQNRICGAGVPPARAAETAAPQTAPQVIAKGLNESLRFGVTAVADIAQPDFAWDDLPNLPLEGVFFAELLAPAKDRIPATLDFARSLLERHSTSTGPWRIGLSPHSPYTVHPALLDEAVNLSAQYKIPLAMHLAESREELELLAHQTGPLRKLLEDLGSWDPTAFSSPRRPINILHQLEVAHHTLIIHGNYLQDDEIAFLARHPEKFSIIYCPRSHAWFGHDPYPLDKFLSAGINVALGTDSHASAPDLNLLAEIRLVAQKFPQLPPETLLRLGTFNGARALGLDQNLGSLEPGKEANLAVVALPQESIDNPYASLLMHDTPVVAVWNRGEFKGRM